MVCHLKPSCQASGITLLVISTAFAESIIIKARICLHDLLRADIYCDRKGAKRNVSNGKVKIFSKYIILPTLFSRGEEERTAMEGNWISVWITYLKFHGNVQNDQFSLGIRINWRKQVFYSCQKTLPDQSYDKLKLDRFSFIKMKTGSFLMQLNKCIQTQMESIHCATFLTNRLSWKLKKKGH